ncbi:MAG TPA: hypothetical protein VNG51_01390 [Ktedonobacteraceae bacterium]|nr:hypothetical protein [Ktedonobacteraceae bacterium]
MMSRDQRRRYPAQWTELAQACKECAGWQCEHCGIKQYALATSKKGTPYFIYLHAAHRHGESTHSPAPALICLCIACHALYDYQHRQRQARVRLELIKHLRLLIAQGYLEVTMS